MPIVAAHQIDSIRLEPEMPRTLKLSFPSPETSEKVRVVAEIPDNEWAILLDFVQYADKLLQGDEVPAVLQARVSIKGNKEGIRCTAAPMPSDGVIDILLFRLRPFVLQDNEPTNFYAVCKILKRYIEANEFRTLFDRLHSLFSGKDFQQQVKIETFAVDAPDKRYVLNSDDSFIKWLYAFQYHRDAKKKKQIQEICGMLPMEYANAIFIQMLIDKIKAILRLAQFIRFCDGGSGRSLTFQF